MKRVEITSHTNIPGTDGPITLYKGSVLDLDDNVAGQIIAAGRAKEVSEDTKTKSTEKAYLSEADRVAADAASPGDALAALVEKRVTEALKAHTQGVASADATKTA